MVGGLQGQAVEEKDGVGAVGGEVGESGRGGNKQVGMGGRRGDGKGEGVGGWEL